MTSFVKASIEQVSDAAQAQPKRIGDPVELQINPATLRLQMASTVDLGKDAGRSKIQYQGSTSTLSFDLVFDTADQGTTQDPVDVRTRVRQLERFVLPEMKKSKSVPPRLRFTYGSFSVVGVMTSLNQDFDFFSSNGIPLRAKCAVTIKVQRPEFDASKAGPGANLGAGATDPTEPGTATAGPALPGAVTGPPPDRTGTALAGESAPDFAARMGLDPRAWKGLEGIADPLRLTAGQQIDFSSALTVAEGVGAAAAGPLDGTALTAAGGLTAVLAGSAARDAASAADRERESFAGGGGSAPAAPGGAPSAAPVPGSVPSGAVPSAAAASTGLVAPVVDPRALGYGFGVPLRARRPLGDAVPVALVQDRTRPAVARAGVAPSTSDPTVPRWVALPRNASAPGTTASGRTTGCGTAPCGCDGRRR